MTNRFVAMQGVLNFRDMGGYRTHDGRAVKEQLFFRSANLAKMTEADRALFKRLGIKTIFDYRDDEEAANNPSPQLEGIQNIRIPAKSADAFKMPVASNGTQSVLDFYQHINTDVFKQFYANMPFDNPSFQRLIDVVKDERNLGLLHHCAIGKDRTGVGGALILMLLDVPRETIMEDYLLTNGQLTPAITHLEQKLTQDYPGIDLAVFHQIMAADERYLQAVFDEIDRRYDSMNSFFYDQFGITSQLRTDLQAKYVQ